MEPSTEISRRPAPAAAIVWSRSLGASLGALWLVVAASVCAMAVGNGASRPMDTHEIYVAQTATEMLERSDYLVPYYGGSIRLQKPPLQYWLAIAAHRVLGASDSTHVSEREARLPSLLSAAALLPVVYLLAFVLSGDSRIGLVAAVLLATSWQFFDFARSSRPEMLYALLCTLAVLGFADAIRRAQARLPNRAAAMLAWLATAAAILAKGPQLVLFSLLGIVLWLRARRPRLSVAVALQPWGALVAAAIVVPYFAYLASVGHGAIAFWGQQMAQNEPMSWWLRPLRFYYPAAVLWGCLPWVVAFGYAVVWSVKAKEANARMLMACILVSLFFVGFAGKLRGHYVLPLVPLCAIVIAWAVVDLSDRARARSASRHLAERLLRTQSALIGVAVCCAPLLTSPAHYISQTPIWPVGAPLLVVAAACAAVAWLLAARAQAAAAFACLATAVLATWSAAAVSGADASCRWSAAAEFAAGVSKAAAEQPLYFDSGVIDPLIYYGHISIVRGSVADPGLRAAGKARALFVCEGQCTSGGRSARGRVLLAQRACGRKDAMVLFEPE